MLNVLLIGFGSIGQEVLRHLGSDQNIRVSHVLTRSSDLKINRASKEFSGIEFVEKIEDIVTLPDFALECAGALAIREHAIALLRRGVSVAMCSVGAFVDDSLSVLVSETAAAHRAQAQLISGAVAGVDALAAARIIGLASVMLTSRKPPVGWMGTPAEEICDLRELEEATVVFQGSARHAARLYPKNANVAATVALAGMGLDQTEVTLIADPGTLWNTHQIEACGDFGQMNLLTSNRPLADNPKTSALAALSAVRAIRNRAAAIII